VREMRREGSWVELGTLVEVGRDRVRWSDETGGLEMERNILYSNWCCRIERFIAALAINFNEIDMA